MPCDEVADARLFGPEEALSFNSDRETVLAFRDLSDRIPGGRPGVADCS